MSSSEGTGAELRYRSFIGTWTLIPESCQYEQGDPPRDGTYRIAQEGARLRFTIDWTDASDNAQQVTFAGVPDGVPAPFDGGALADALCVTVVSPRELNSSALYRGKERMVAQRQLDATEQAMRVVQVVRLSDGKSEVNVSVYRREVLH